MFEYLWSILSFLEANPITTLICFVLISILLKKYNNGGVCHLSSDLSSKIIVITGSNTGIGKYTAQELAKMGGTIIMACRDLQKAEEAKSSILNSTTNALKIDIMLLDLCDLSSIREFVKRFKTKYNRLDILINNAGIMALPQKKLTKDGFEMQIGTNHFGHFLLTNLLLDVLKASQPSRIVNVASLAHLYGYINLDDVNSEKFYNDHLTYGGSKLANIWFTKELAKRLEGSGVKTCCLHPGVVRTELIRYTLEKNLHLKVILWIFYPLYWFFTKNVKQGSQTNIYCALLPHEKLENGKYYSDCGTGILRPAARDTEKMRKLWEISEKMVKL